MPHQIIEYSTNLEDKLDIDGLIAALHACAASLEPLPLGGLRTRAYPTNRYRIADCHADNGFIAVYLRIGKGRTEETRIEVGETLFKTLCDYVQPVFDTSPIALSYEVQEIDPTTRWNQNNLRDHIAQRQQTGS
ncbi:MAG: 5-carboxymethyl-2-hydroxymuconate isomerase [Pseudomonadota bacterium]